MKKSFSGYSSLSILGLVRHLYKNYVYLFVTDLASNIVRIRDAYNDDEPTKSLYKRINYLDYYVATVGKPITIGKIVQIAYGLVPKTSQYMKYFWD